MSASSFTIGRVMSSFFDRLFRNNLIRILASGATWNAAGQSLRRAHKDKRARKHLLGLVLIVGFLVLVPVVGIAYLIFIVGTGAWLFLPFAILIDSRASPMGAGKRGVEAAAHVFRRVGPPLCGDGGPGRK
jgi:hypothetical protein